MKKTKKELIENQVSEILDRNRKELFLLDINFPFKILGDYKYHLTYEGRILYNMLKINNFSVKKVRNINCSIIKNKFHGNRLIYLNNDIYFRYTKINKLKKLIK